MQFSVLQKFRSWRFTFHMYKYWVQIAVVILCQTAFKCRKSLQDVLCCSDYAERVIAISPHKIQSEYYGGNISVSIEGITLEHFNSLPQKEINTSTKPCPCNELFHFVLLDDSKQDDATTNEHRKRFIELLKNKNYWLHH